MTAVVVDLATHRAKRADERRIVELIRSVNGTLLTHTAGLAKRVMVTRLAELETEHAVLLAKARPLLRELLLLQTACLLSDRRTIEPGDAAFALAVSAASFTDDADLANALPARIEALRAALPDLFARQEREYSPGYFTEPTE